MARSANDKVASDRNDIPNATAGNIVDSFILHYNGTTEYSLVAGKGRRMAAEVLATEVTGLFVSPDGSAFQIRVNTASGEQTSIHMPSSVLTSLTMSLFGAADKAYKLREQSDDVKLVFPADRFELKQTDCGEQFILSLETPDGFQASFAIRQGLLAQIGEVAAYVATRDEVVTRLN